MSTRQRQPVSTPVCFLSLNKKIEEHTIFRRSPFIPWKHLQDRLKAEAKLLCYLNISIGLLVRQEHWGKGEAGAERVPAQTQENNQQLCCENQKSVTLWTLDARSIGEQPCYLTEVRFFLIYECKIKDAFIVKNHGSPNVSTHSFKEKTVLPQLMNISSISHFINFLFLLAFSNEQ